MNNGQETKRRIENITLFLKAVDRQGYIYFRVPKDVKEDMGLERDSRCQVTIKYLGYEKKSHNEPKHFNQSWNEKKEEVNKMVDNVLGKEDK